MPLTTPYERVFYVSDGITAEYSFPFVPISRDFIHVNLKHTDGRIEYDVSVEVPLDKTGEIIGVIAFNKEENKVPKAGTIIMIERRTPLTQDTDYSKQIQFSAKALDYSFDKLQAQLQELTERIDTSVISTNPFQEPITLDVLTKKNHGQYLQFDYDKNALKGGLFFNKNNYFGVSSNGTIWSYYYDTQIIDNKITEIKTYSDQQNNALEKTINEKINNTNTLITKNSENITKNTDSIKDINNTLNAKQDKLKAGDNIIINGNVISATGGGAGFDIVAVQELPVTGQKGIIYLLAKDGTAPDVYDEYVWITATQTFELIGSTKVDLSGYLPLSGGTITGPITLGMTGDPYSNVDVLKSSSGASLVTGMIESGSVSTLAIRTPLTIFKELLPLADVGQSFSKVPRIYVEKINNGADISIPTTGGTMALAENVATAIADAVANIDALPDQTGNAGKVLITDGSTASWQEAPASGTKVIIKRYN